MSLSKSIQITRSECCRCGSTKDREDADPETLPDRWGVIDQARFVGGVVTPPIVSALCGACYDDIIDFFDGGGPATLDGIEKSKLSDMPEMSNQAALDDQAAKAAEREQKRAIIAECDALRDWFKSVVRTSELAACFQDVGMSHHKKISARNGIEKLDALLDALRDERAKYDDQGKVPVADDNIDDINDDEIPF